MRPEFLIPAAPGDTNLQTLSAALNYSAARHALASLGSVRGTPGLYQVPPCFLDALHRKNILHCRPLWSRVRHRTPGGSYVMVACLGESDGCCHHIHVL
jgi:hypothetical protein